MLAKVIIAAVAFFAARWLFGLSFMFAALVAVALAWLFGDKIAGWFSPAEATTAAA